MKIHCVMNRYNNLLGALTFQSGPFGAAFIVFGVISECRGILVRKFFTSMWSITTPIVIGEEMQILAHENGRRTMTRLWLKLIFASVLFLGPLLLLNVVSARWLGVVLGLTAVSFSLAPIFICLDMFLFYHLPGIRLTDEGLWVKKGKSISHKFYSYQDLVQVQQLTTTKKKTKHQLKLIFLGGSSWFTNKRSNTGVPFLIHLTNAVKKRCDCSVWPVFDEEFASEKPG